ncbi:MAG: TraB/GumN family protein, partial [Bacteroidota bacterium]
MKGWKPAIWTVLALALPLQTLAQGNSLLWEMTGNGTKQPSYLFGTMHLPDERLFLFGDSVMAKLERSEAVAGELVLDMSDMSSLFQLMNVMMMTETTLKELISAEDYAKVQAAAMEKLGPMGAMLVDRVKPMFLSMMLMNPSDNQQMDLAMTDSLQVMDMYFQEVGKRQGKPVYGLETVEEQMAAIDAIPLKEQAQMLVESLEETGTDVASSDAFQQLFDSYLRQDLSELAGLLKEDGLGANFNESLVIHRNKVMAHRIDSIAGFTSCFYAIGALHLPGPEGLVNLLRQEGYRVEPVYSPFGFEKGTITYAGEWY